MCERGSSITSNRDSIAMSINCITLFLDQLTTIEHSSSLYIPSLKSPVARFQNYFRVAIFNMSLYAENKVAYSSQTNGVPEILVWHPTQPILAVCAYSENVANGAVHFFDKEGQSIPRFKPRTRQSCPECAAWHPSSKTIGVAWRDGTMFLYFLEKDVPAESFVSAAPVKIIQWSYDGNHLIAVNKANQVLIWTKEASKDTINITKPAITASLQQTATCLEILKQNLSYGKSGLLEPVSALKAASAGSSRYPSFLIGCSAGTVYYLDQHGRIQEGLRLQGSVQTISFFEIFGSKYKTAYIVMDSLNVLRYQISHTYAFEETLNTTCPGKTPIPSLCWLNPEVLAIATGENYLRTWDCLKCSNIDLPLNDFGGTEPSEALRSATLNKNSGVLMGQTNIGKLLFWNVSPSSSTGSDTSRSSTRIICSTLWSLTLSSQIRLTAADVSGPSFAIADAQNVFVLQQRPLSFAFTYPLLAIQTSTNSVSVIDEQRKKSAIQKVKFQISGVAVKEDLLVIWSEETVSVWQISGKMDDTGLALTEVSTFRRDYEKVRVYNGALVAAKSKSINFLTVQGVIKADIKVPPNEGTVALMDIKNFTCVVAVTEGYIKTFNLDKPDPKSWNKTKAVKEAVSSFGSFKSLSVNRDGLYVAFLNERSDGSPDPNVYLWDLERNAITSYTFDTAIPSQVAWQSDDQRQLCVNLTATPTSKQTRSDRLAFLFPSSDKGMVLGSELDLNTNGSTLLLGACPPFAFIYANSVEQGGKLAVIKRFLPDCEGFLPEHKDDMKAIADFSYYAALGQFSRAINSVNTTSQGVWNHLARLCVKRGKLEYAKVCLSKLGQVAILADLRKFAESNGDSNALLGRLAALLQMKETAEDYFKKSGQTDLIENLRKACGDFGTDKKGDMNDELKGDAMLTTERLKQRGLLYEQAQHELTFRNTENTVEKLMRAKCEKFDVPQFLLQKQPEELQDYIDQANDMKLYGWYAHFLESQNLTDDALEYYEKAHDLKAQVRIFCGRDEQNEALILVRKSHNQAAAFQLAHAMEVDGEADPKILGELYEMAGAFRNAIRICMENEMDEEVVKLATKSQKPDAVMAAKYLEGKGLIDKAITVYHSAGRINKATDLAFTQGYYGNIETISEDINETSDPRLIERCVEYFAEHNQVDRAVNLLIKAKRIVEAVNLCIKYQMTVDEKLISSVLDRSTTDIPDAVQRRAVIEGLANRCMAQGLFHEAARMFMEVSRPEAAMNALVKTGDIEAIIRYIRLIRDPDALIIAGNNLQSHPWHQRKDIFDAIVLAYKRAGATLYLASFYDSWGETACESGRYDVALNAFNQSLEMMKAVKSTEVSPQDLDNTRKEMETKHKVVEYFLEVQRTAQSSPQEAIPAAEELLQHTRWDAGVRTGHVYGLLIAATLSIGAIQKSRKILQRLKEVCPAGFNWTDFVDESLLIQLQ